MISLPSLLDFFCSAAANAAPRENLTGPIGGMDVAPGSLTRLRRRSLAALRRWSLLRPRPGAPMRRGPGALKWLDPGTLMWLRRRAFIAILVALAVVPGPASAARPCTSRGCQSAGEARWTRLLPGSWVAGPGLAGTTPAQGDAYAAMGGQVAAIGIGTTVFAYRSRSGEPVWDSSLARFRAGSRIVSVRA